MKEQTLNYVWNIYSNLHEHGEKHKEKVFLWKRLFLVLSILTALLGTIAGYLQVFHLCLPRFIIDFFALGSSPDSYCFENDTVTKKIGYLLGILSTLVLSVNTYFASKIMLSDKETIWKNSKSMAEALLSHIFRFVTNTGEYKSLSENIQNEKLLDQANEYLMQSENLIIRQELMLESKPQSSLPIEDYIRVRLLEKKDNYYKSNALNFLSQLKNYERITLALGILSVLFSSLVTVYDASVLIALITTITSTIATYYGSLKLREQKNSFNATAKQLEILLMKYQYTNTINEEQLINLTETILIAENTAWQNFWIQPKSPTNEARIELFSQ